MKNLLFAILAFLGLGAFSCSSKNTTSKETTELPKENKILVAYFSATGNTKKVADTISAITGGTLFEIEPVQPYSEADLDGWNESARGTRESKDRSTRPEVKNKVDNMAQYDTIYLGFPIWWYTCPTIVNTFLEQYDLTGKTIIPFATSGGSGFGETEKDLKVSAPNAKFKPGKVLNNMNKSQIEGWIGSVNAGPAN